MWVTLLRNDVDFHYFNTDTVYYRTNESISHSNESFFNEKLDFYNRLYFYDELCIELYQNHPHIYKKRKRFFFERDLCLHFFKNRNSFYNRILLKLLLSFTK